MPPLAESITATRSLAPDIRPCRRIPIMAVEGNTRSGQLRPRARSPLTGLQPLPRPPRPQRMPMDQCKDSNPPELPRRAARPATDNRAGFLLPSLRLPLPKDSSLCRYPSPPLPSCSFHRALMSVSLTGMGPTEEPLLRETPAAAMDFNPDPFSVYDQESLTATARTRLGRYIFFPDPGNPWSKEFGDASLLSCPQGRLCVPIQDTPAICFLWKSADSSRGTQAIRTCLNEACPHFSFFPLATQHSRSIGHTSAEAFLCLLLCQAAWIGTAGRVTRLPR